MASFHTISEELRLSTDSQTILRTFSSAREDTETIPREEVFALVELPDRPAGGEDLIRAIFQSLQEICFLDQNQDSYERFEAALKEINAIIAEFRSSLPNRGLNRINAIIGFISGRELHFTQSGEAEAYLIRKGALTTITEGLAGDENAVDVFVNIASGKTENRDKVILSSERLLRYATKNELTKIFSTNKEIGLALEELDEIIVLEGAQTTGVFALDIVTEAIATRSATVESVSREKNFVGMATKYMNQGLNWMRDKLPEGTKLPGGKELKLDKNYVILGFLVVAILILLSVSWSLGSARSSVKLEEVKTALESVQTNIDLAKTRRNIGDKPQAYTLLKEAETTATDLVKSGLAMEEANAKIVEIMQLRDEMDNIKRFQSLTPLVDISSANKTVALVGLEDFHGKKIAYDAHSIYDTALDAVSKSQEIDKTASIKVAHYFPDRDALLILTTDGKVLEWRDGDLKPMSTDDETWKSAVDVGMYSKYIYMLDPVNNQIWKYSRNNENYSTASQYNTNADLTKAVSIAIDGDLWILANDADGDMSNDIIRVRKGERKPLQVSDLPATAWQNPKKIFTNDSLKFVYVLDQANKRILRFYKDPAEAGTEVRNLVYNMQYLFDGLKEVKDFWVDTAEQKIYVMDSQKVYEANI